MDRVVQLITNSVIVAWLGGGQGAFLECRGIRETSASDSYDIVVPLDLKSGSFFLKTALVILHIASKLPKTSFAIQKRTSFTLEVCYGTEVRHRGKMSAQARLA